MDIRTLLAFGTGVGIEIRERDLAVTITHVRPNGVKIAGSTVIQDFRERPAGEWGSEYLKFLREHGASHISATVVAPKREVIVRQVALPGVANKEFGAAVGYQVETLHPYGEDEVVYGWQRISENGTALIGILRRSTFDAYLEKFAEAGVAVASFTFSAAALHGAARLLATPPAQGFLATAATESGEIEVYGESPSRPVFSAQFDLPTDRAAALAAAELRLPPETAPLRLYEILPPPVSASIEYDFSRSTMPYAASPPGLSLAAGGQHASGEKRRKLAPDVCPFGHSGGMLLLAAGAVFGYEDEERRYWRRWRRRARLQPQVKNRGLDKSRTGWARVRLLTNSGAVQIRSDTLNELTKPWLRDLDQGIDLSRDAARSGKRNRRLRC
jgi:hypothetical protein